MSSCATPLRRSSAPSARPARPRLWWRDSTQAREKVASSISLTSANRASTVSAASSGTPRRRRAVASSAWVRGAAVSSRRQISRATDSGSSRSSEPRPDGSAAAPGLSPLARRGRPGTSRVLLSATQARHRRDGRRGRNRSVCRHLRVQLRSDAELLLDLLLDLVGHVRVLEQEIPGVLLALPQLIAVVGVPGTGLADDALLHAQVNKSALTADSVAVQNIELGDLEWRRAIVRDDVFSDQVVELFHFHIEGPAPLGGQNCRDAREPELL